MGNQTSKKPKLDDIEEKLFDSYKNTDVEFTLNEMTNFKLRLRDAEFYFHTKFDIFFYFSNYVFRDRLYYLYENFTNKIESYGASRLYATNLSVLIDFEDETLNIAKGMKADWEPLFTIVFEKLEINILLFFIMTNVDHNYLKDFFTQMTDSADLYKYNRKFDCLYFLLPNTHFFIKNESSLLYVINQISFKGEHFKTDEVFKIDSDFFDSIYANKDKLLNAKYPKTEANNFIEVFIGQTKPSLVRVDIEINFNCEVESFMIENENSFRLIEYLVEFCPYNIVHVEIKEWMSQKVLKFFVKKLILLIDKSILDDNVLCFRLIIKTQSKSDNKKTKLISMLNFIKNIILDLNMYNILHGKRKLVVELIEINPIPSISTQNLNSAGNTTASIDMTTHQTVTEYTYKYEKLFFHWFLNAGSDCLKLTSINNILKQNSKIHLNKLSHLILDFIVPSHIHSYTCETKTVSGEELKLILK